jgi:lipopolysaccharide transport system permease protein
MLVVYTFVFSVVFKARWGAGEEESRVDFAITLFAGLIVFNLFAEIMNRAPNLVVNNVNYVKKVIFPLEMLTLVSAGVVVFHSFISLLVLLTAQIIFRGHIPLTILYLPVVLLPLLLTALGVSWFLSATAVFIRDVANITNVLTTILLYISAVFFPISRLPETYQLILQINPVATIINESRKVIIFGEAPNWPLLGGMWLIGLFAAIAGYWWFQKTRRGFADVL